MKKRDIKKDEINEITQKCKYSRERAFFAFMRQSGLPQHIISQLKIGDLERILEPDTPIPCKITISEFKSPPHFIAGEAVHYLKLYLATRKKNRAPENLLFTARDENHKIDTKNVSRRFRLIAQKLPKDKSFAYKVKVGKPSELTLSSLTYFYKNNTKLYRKEAENNLLADDEFFRSLYKNHAMLPLEIEKQITYKYDRKQFQKEIEYQKNQVEEKNQTIAKDNEYITSIITLLYNNKGDYETGENIKLGDYFIELWQKAREEQFQNLKECWNEGIKGCRKTKLLPRKDILEELTKTLKRIIKPYEELKKTQGIK
jgi:hypothetical protein